MGFIADDQVKIRQSISLLRLIDDIQRLVGRKDRNHTGRTPYCAGTDPRDRRRQFHSVSGNRIGQLTGGH